MIKLTYAQLTAAVSSGQDAQGRGAYARFAGIRKTITAGHKNRKMPAAVQEELNHFVKQRDDLVARFGGALNESKTNYVWPDDKQADAEKALAELMAQTVELPGDVMKLADLLDGGLLEADYDALEPFLTE
jgi:hypothetical protein